MERGGEDEHVPGVAVVPEAADHLPEEDEHLPGGEPREEHPRRDGERRVVVAAAGVASTEEGKNGKAVGGRQHPQRPHGSSDVPKQGEIIVDTNGTSTLQTQKRDAVVSIPVPRIRKVRDYRHAVSIERICFSPLCLGMKSGSLPPYLGPKMCALCDTFSNLPTAGPLLSFRLVFLVISL